MNRNQYNLTDKNVHCVITFSKCVIIIIIIIIIVIIIII